MLKLKILNFQLHNKFDALTKEAEEDKKKLEERRRKLEDDMSGFNRGKAQFLSQSQSHNILSFGKSKKK